MNKTLAKVLLLCMILTCLTSGTLAVYSAQIDETAQTSIAAKRFYIGVNSANEFNLSVAPGETVRTDFAIVNFDANEQPTEVNMDLTIQADFSELYQTFPGIKARLVEDGNASLSCYANDNGYFDYEEKNAFIADQNQSRSFHMEFTWENTSENIVYAKQKVGNLSIYIAGTQHID